VPTALAIVALLLAILPQAAGAKDPVIAAAGDISCGPGPHPPSSCRDKETSDLLVGAGLAAVLPLGDIQYERGTLDSFHTYYDPTWGRVKSITRPAIGNHEYGTAGAAGYFAYFGAAAGKPGQGWYSYDVGAWHLIALNSNCGSVGCGPGSPQVEWLESDLAAHRPSCTLAYWHHPHFSSGRHGDAGTTDDFWDTLHRAGADVVLAGHDHSYERFAPQTEAGVADPAYGIREFVVGTGGRSHYSFESIKPNSQARNDDTYGVLFLTLRPASYTWRFASIAGSTFTDTGSDDCHGAPGASVLRLIGPRGARLTRAGTFRVTARCAAKCRVSLRATVSIGRRKVQSLRTRRTLAAERSRKLEIRFSKRTQRAVRRGLARRARLAVTIRGTAKDPAGNAGSARLKLRLRR
jgi:hypothetical protein